MPRLRPIYDCPTCRNWGKVTFYVDGKPQPPVTCPTCHGKGK